MSTSNFDQGYKQIKFKQGVRANVDKTAASNSGVQGEPAYTTDGKNLWIHDGTAFQLVPTLDTAAVYNGDVVTYGGQIVWQI
jgi:hypothetical protein